MFNTFPTVYYKPPKFCIFQLLDGKNKFALKFLSSRCPTLFGETCGSRFKAYKKIQVVCLMGYDMIKLHSGKNCILTHKKNH